MSQEHRIMFVYLRTTVGYGTEIKHHEYAGCIDPTKLDYSKLSGCREWSIGVTFDGESTMPLVTCDWRSAPQYVAYGEYLFWNDTTERIATHDQIIPFVKRWLTRALLRGVCHDGIWKHPHLKIYGVHV